ncbi:hypothetical protein [Paenibacillus lutrae]|uniref:Uncharacterized protein n=1 Tax=Paenibacillus lutrae TaxID=2078573 RepID=A0A7X3FLT5_9BACL|nr:hypothetical protein [Paenibacillus lutrae]MVP02083.1 hypothetical protein [Paenibacillus lutrae]
MRSFKVISTSVLALTMAFTGTIVSAADASPDIPVHFANGVKNDLSPQELKSLTKNLPPTATNVTIMESTSRVDKKVSSKIAPSGNACEPGYSYTDTTKTGSYVFKLAEAGSRYINRTGSNITFTSTIGTAKTISGEGSAKGEFDWKVIEAEVGFKISGSYTWTTSEGISVTVRPQYQGWIDYGTSNDYWSGYYTYVRSDCTEGSSFFLKVNGPRYKATVAHETRVY